MAQQPSPVVLLGVPFHRVTMEDTLQWMADAIHERQPRYVATANLDFAAQASRDVELQRILLEADLVLCDGTPLIWASRWMQAPLPERVAGSDLVPQICARAEQAGWRLYFLGATEEVLQEAQRRLLEKHPRLKIVGMDSPPHRKLHEFDHDTINARILAAAPDILLVGFGCPKQEKWILMNYQKVKVPVSIGVGATLDFIAGKFSRAPAWMGRVGLEWVYRLAQEPKRLASRYWFDLFFFARAAARQKAALAFTQDRTHGHSTQMTQRPRAKTLGWNGRIDAATIASTTFHAPEPSLPQPNLIIDLSSATSIDSSGLGRLVSMHKKCREFGGYLVLAGAPERVFSMIRAVHLESVFHYADDVPSAVAWIDLEQSMTTSAHQRGSVLELNLSGDLRADAAEEVLKSIQQSWTQHSQGLELKLNLAQVNFMDSTGLSVLIRSFKMTSLRPGASFSLTNATPAVRNVLQLARLDHVFGLHS